jgi:hypothetical protein
VADGRITRHHVYEGSLAVAGAFGAARRAADGPSGAFVTAAGPQRW